MQYGLCDQIYLFIYSEHFRIILFFSLSKSFMLKAVIYWEAVEILLKTFLILFFNYLGQYIFKSLFETFFLFFDEHVNPLKSIITDYILKFFMFCND